MTYTEEFEGSKNMKENTKKSGKELSRDEYLYHNTELLLKKYRDVVWSVEVSLNNAKTKFEREFECDLETFLDLSYSAGADLSGTDIQGHLRTLERNRKMLKIIHDSVEVIRNKHRRGEMYYQILYITFLSNDEKEYVGEIVDALIELGFVMSEKSFYRKKHEAIECLSNILWGYSSRNCIDIINELIDE